MLSSPEIQKENSVELIEKAPEDPEQITTLLKDNATTFGPLNRILKSCEYDKPDMRVRRDAALANINLLLDHWPNGQRRLPLLQV